jgi:hypothetical protein
MPADLAAKKATPSINDKSEAREIRRTIVANLHQSGFILQLQDFYCFLAILNGVFLAEHGVFISVYTFSGTTNFGPDSQGSEEISLRQ